MFENSNRLQASRLATDMSNAPPNRRNPAVEMRKSRPIATITRVAKVTLTMIAFAVVVIGIVALKSWIWIPHLAR
jgi:hypothetical protein